MRWSATKLRWLLLAGVLLLAGLVAGFFGLARYRAGKIWQRILARNGINLQQDSNGITYSQSSGGRTVFTLHASKATPLGKNRYVLHDAVLILYGREPGRNDRIYGKEFEYDQAQGVARAVGEVHMDLQAPEPGGKAPVAGTRPELTFGAQDEAAEDPGVIHVHTSGLVYMRKLGLAATGERTEFRYGGITCISRGAEFDSAQSVVRLLADVHMNGMVKKAAFSLTATHAELNRSANTTDITAPVLTSGARSARAAHALLHLLKDGSLQAGEADGGVQLRAGMQTVSAPQATATFGTGDRPQHARLFTGVSFIDADATKPARASAAVMDLNWTADGLLHSVLANGSVQYTGHSRGRNGDTERKLAADQLTADFAPVPGTTGQRVMLQHAHLLGRAKLASSSQPAAGSRVATEIGADDLTAVFAPAPGGKAVAQSLEGSGHTRLEQTRADGSRQRSTGDTLRVAFAPPTDTGGTQDGPAEVSAAVQTGDVAILAVATAKSGQTPSQLPGQTTGRAGKAVYAGDAKTLTLTGDGGSRASVAQSQGDMQADTITVEQATGDAQAEGDVSATSLGREGGAATHVLAARARLLHTAGLTEFFGLPGKPAQLWQGGSQVQAAQITLDEKQHGLSARPGAPGEMIHAVFATTARTNIPAGKDRGAGATKESSISGVAGGVGVAGESLPEAARNTVRVSAARMDYDDAEHQALFTGEVRLTGVTGEISAERAVATLKAATGKPEAAKDTAGGPNLSGSLERMVMLGDVRLTQPGRTGVGQQLTYSAESDSFVLTGAPGRPPRVTGEHGSIVTGATLLFRNADSTIVVAGTQGGAKAPSGTRVHTETDLKQKP